MNLGDTLGGRGFGHKVAYGQFISPDYLTAAKVILAVGTLTGQPQAQRVNQLLVQVFVPAGLKPAGGWPVALFGHGFGDSMYGAPWTVASVMASRGLATVSLNVVGHGGGAQGSLGRNLILEPESVTPRPIKFTTRFDREYVHSPVDLATKRLLQALRGAAGCARALDRPDILLLAHAATRAERDGRCP